MDKVALASLKSWSRNVVVVSWLLCSSSLSLSLSRVAMIRWYVSSKVFDMVLISEMMVLICSSKSTPMLLVWAVSVDEVRTFWCLLCILRSVLLVRC